MSIDNIKILKVNLDKLKIEEDNFIPSDDVSQNNEKIGEIEAIITNIDTLLEDMEDDEELANQKQLSDKFYTQKKDLEIIKFIFIRKKEKARTIASQELLRKGDLKLKDENRKKAEKDMVLNQKKEVDEINLIVDSINKNVNDANNNIAKSQEEILKAPKEINTREEALQRMEKLAEKLEKDSNVFKKSREHISNKKLCIII